MEEKRIELKLDRGSSSGVLLSPPETGKAGVLLAHGAGGTMNQPFMNFFHRGIAEAGYPCLKFNFLYSEARRKVPDPQPLLLSCFRKAMDALPGRPLVMGGKSMGGRMASYLGGEERVAGLFFLGYPLHPPGRPEQLRDQHLYSIRKPMFFAGGTKDPFAQPDLMAATLKRIGKHATTFFVEGGGHSFELPKKSGRTERQVLEEVLAHLLHWLNALG